MVKTKFASARAPLQRTRSDGQAFKPGRRGDRSSKQKRPAEAERFELIKQSEPVSPIVNRSKGEQHAYAGAVETQRFGWALAVPQ